MGHAHHFLSRLDRVSLQEVELSLGLYNNVPLLRFILERSGLPKSAERVAISLDDRNEGPFLIVTRDAKFVTCLGRGMHHDLPTVRRWQLDVLAERHHELRACMRPIEQVPENERAFYRMFSPIFEVGPALPRERFLEFSAWQPMTFGAYRGWAEQVYDTAQRFYYALGRIEHIRPVEREGFARYSENLWGLRHTQVMTGVGDPIEYYESEPRPWLEKINESHAHTSASDCFAPLCFAAAWCTARFGGAFLPICLSRFSDDADIGNRLLMAAMELAAIAGAHPEHREAVIRAARDACEVPANDNVANEFAVTRAALARHILRALERTDDLDVRAACFGAELLFARRHPAIAKHGWRTVHDVPLEVARPYASMQLFDWSADDTAAQLIWLAASIARYRPEDFYLSERWLKEFRFPWTAEEVLRHIRMQKGLYEVREPVKAEKVPGRNDPCPCASGAKYKKCCAVAPKKPAEAPKAPERRYATLADGIPPREKVKSKHDSIAPAAPATQPELDVAAPANDDDIPEADAAPCAQVA